MAFQVSPHQRLALLYEGRYTLAEAPVQHGGAEVAESEGGARRVPKLLVESHGLFEGFYRRSKVPLEDEDPT